MTDPKIIQYIDQMCVKDGDIQVQNIRWDGSYTLVVPVINGGEEFNAKQIATLDLEFSYDGEDVTLLNFPKQLLSDEDYIYIAESIDEFLALERENLVYCQNIDESKITDTARASVTWDSYGIAVDLNYSYDALLGYGESALCFSEPYDGGAPDQTAWDEAQYVGQFLKEKYHLPLVIEKDESFLKHIESQCSKQSLDDQIQSAAVCAAESEVFPRVKTKEPEAEI